VLRLIGKQIGFFLQKRTAFLLPLQDLEEEESGSPVHLFQFLDWHQGREGFSLSLDDELIVPEFDPVEKVPQSSPYFDGGDRFFHELLQLV
jgi:hypothetical protein